LLLVHVDPPANFITPPEAAWSTYLRSNRYRKKQLDKVAPPLRSEGFRAQAISVTGPLHDELLSTVKQYKVDLIVLGTHGKKGLERLLLGSDAEAVLRHAGCPVPFGGPAVPNLGDKTCAYGRSFVQRLLEPRGAEVVALCA